MSEETKSWGYPKREDVNALLDYHVVEKAKWEARAALAEERLEFALLAMETEEGIFLFPDGSTLPAGIKITGVETASAL